MLSPPLVDPSALALPTTSVPALTLLPPLKLLEPERVVVPVPLCVKAADPDSVLAMEAAPVLVAVKEAPVMVPLPVMEPLPRETLPIETL